MKKILSDPARALANMLFYQPALHWFCPVQTDMWDKQWLKQLVDEGYITNRRLIQLGNGRDHEGNKKRYAITVYDITRKARRDLIDGKATSPKRSDRPSRKPVGRRRPEKQDSNLGRSPGNK